MCIVQEIQFYVNPLKQLQYSPNGNILAVVDNSSYYTLFDTQNEYDVALKIKCEPSDCQFITFSKDGQFLGIIGHFGNQIEIYNMKTRKLMKTLVHPKNTSIISLKFSSDNNNIFVLNKEYGLQCFDINKSQIILEKQDDIRAFTVTNNDKYVITVDGNCLVKLWNLQKDSYCQIFIGHSCPINCILLSQNNQKMYTTGGPDGIFEWDFLGDLGDFFLEPLITDEQDEQKKQLPYCKNFQKIVPGNCQGQKRSKDIQKYNVEFVQDVDGKKFDKKQTTLPQTFQWPVPTKLYKEPAEELPVLPARLRVTETQFLQYVLKDEEFIYNKQKKYSRKQLFQPKNIFRKDKYRQKYKLPLRHYKVHKSSLKLPKTIQDIKRNPMKPYLDYLTGFNSETHDNFIWNQCEGWIAYTVDNVLQIENLLDEKNQRIILMPDYISVLSLSPNNSYIAVGASSYNSDGYTNIYLLDTINFKVCNTFSFHTKGIQAMSFSQSSQYLVSIAGRCDNSVCVWNIKSGKMISGTHAITVVNDVSCRRLFNRESDYLLEFLTGGRQVINVYQLTREKGKNVLMSQKIFISPLFKGDQYDFEAEITTVQWGDEYIFAGLEHGEVLVYKQIKQGRDNNQFKFLKRVLVAQCEIYHLRLSINQNKLLICSYNGAIYQCDIKKEPKDQDPITQPQLIFQNKYTISSLQINNFWGDMNSQIARNQVLIASKSGIQNLEFEIKDEFCEALTKFQLSQSLPVVKTVTSQDQIIQFGKLIDNLFFTLDNSGIIKIWDIINAKQVYEEDNNPFITTQVIYHKEQQKMVCFQLKGKLRTIKIKKNLKTRPFTYIFQSEVYKKEDSPAMRHMDVEDYICGSAYFNGSFGQQFILLSKYGRVYYSDLKNMDERVYIKRIYKAKKEINSIKIHKTNLTLFIAYTIGSIDTYKIEKPLSNLLAPTLSSIDQFDLVDVVKDLITIKNKEFNDSYVIMVFYLFTYQFYKNHNVVFDYKINDPIYLCAIEVLDYLIIRNYFGQEVLAKVKLRGFPMSIKYDNLSQKVIYGTDGGFLEILDEPYEKSTFEMNQKYTNLSTKIRDLKIIEELIIKEPEDDFTRHKNSQYEEQLQLKQQEINKDIKQLQLQETGISENLHQKGSLRCYLSGAVEQIELWQSTGRLIVFQDSGFSVYVF